MRQQGADTGLVRNRQRTPDGILRQSDANAQPLVLNRYPESSQDHDRNRVLAHALAHAHALRRLQRVHLAYRQTEESGDTFNLGGHEGSGGPAGLGLPGVANQPVIERRFAANKIVQAMPGQQGLRRAQRHAASHRALRANRSRRPALYLGRLIQCIHQRAVLTAGHHEQPLIQQGLLGGMAGAVEDEIGQ